MKRVVSFVLIAVLVFSLCSCGSSSKQLGTITLEEVTSPVELHNSMVASYLKEDNPEGILKYCSTDDQSEPAGVRFNWKWNGESKPDDFAVKASESENFENYFIEHTTHNSLKMFNFKMNTKYYWKVIATIGKQTVESEVKSFTTEDDVARMLTCGGITNFRDFGNWKTEDGKTVRQGMVFRCSRLNENESTKRLITDSGMDLMKRLGIKGELDLRGSSEAGIRESCIEGANYLNVSIIGKVAEKNYFVSNDDELVKIFEFLGKRENYPLIIHCKVGADRTGFVSYTLSALLGVGEKDCCRDYLLTDFAYNPTWTLDNILPDYVAGYNSCEGATLSEKVENHLLSLGVSQSDIDTFKEMMLQ